MSEDAGGSLPRRPGDVSGTVQCGRGHHQAAGWYEVPPDPRTVSFCCEALGWLVQLLMLMFCFPFTSTERCPSRAHHGKTWPNPVSQLWNPPPPFWFSLSVSCSKLQSHHQRSHHEVEPLASGVRRSLCAIKPSNLFVSSADTRPPSGLSRTWSAVWRWGGLKASEGCDCDGPFAWFLQDKVTGTNGETSGFERRSARHNTWDGRCHCRH